MCLLEDSQPVCYCVPDYHGQLCELRYDDCESKFAKCENGGTCIDGINNFTCACPLNYSGDMCLDYNPTTSRTILTSQKTIVSISTAKTIPLPTMIYFTSQETPEKTEGVSTTPSIFQEVSTIPESPDVENFTSSTIESTSYPNLKNISIVNSRSNVTNVSRPKTTPEYPSIIEQDLTTSRIYLTAFSTAETSIGESVDFGTSTVPYSVEISDSGRTEAAETTRDSIASGETSKFDDRSTVFQISETSTTKVSSELPMSPSSPEVAPMTEFTRGDEEISTEFSRETTEFSESFATFFDGEARGFSGTERIESTVGGSVDDSSTDLTEASVETSFTTSGLPEVALTTRTSWGRDQNRYNCSDEKCRNVKCAKNATKCDCDSSDRCKNGPSIENAAFNGKSYVRQQVNIDGDGSLRIYCRLKTKAKSGVLLHAFFDDERYVLLYMEGGQLKFQFSCGLQTMLLGEIDSPINNGFDVDVEMR